MTEFHAVLVGGRKRLTCTPLYCIIHNINKQSTNLLWRVRHGELPDKLQAKVFWILIGADDLALGMCSEDVVILGILRVAEEIAIKYPNAKVVIQGLSLIHI